MEGERNPTHDAPFGYTFETNAPDSSSYPPAGPNLLDSNELSYLDSFFQDPNTADSNLPTFSTDFQGDNANIFDSTNAEFMPQSLSNMSTNAMALAQSAAQVSKPELQRPLSASADVYAAAGILHGNTVRQPGPPFNNYGPGFGSNTGDAAHMNGYTFNQVGNPQLGEYDFEQVENGLYGYDEQDTSNPYMAGLQSRLQGWTNTRPSQQLNFGSDDNFRNSNFSGIAPTELPDKNLVDAVKHNFGNTPANTNAKGGNKGKAKPAEAARKRQRQQDVEETEADPKGHGQQEEDSRQKRRKKELVKAENEDEWDLMEHPVKGKKSKKKPAPTESSTTANAGTAGPPAVAEAQPPTDSTVDDKSTSTPASAKKKQKTVTLGPKERRENLTEEQKRNNHIQSEQKRRNLIKKGFEDLNNMVPGLRSSAQSKSIMLTQAAEFIRKLRDDNVELKGVIEAVEKG